MQSEQGQEIKEIVHGTLGFFVQEYKPMNLSFPVLPNTFSLWRKYSYMQVQKSEQYKKDPDSANFYFYLQCQCNLLHIFLQKILEHLQQRPSSPTSSQLPQNVQVSDQLLTKYNLSLEKHSLYQELLEDLVNLPYLKRIFPEKTKFQLKYQFLPDIVGQQVQEGMKEKVSASLVNKGFGILAEKIFTKTFIIQASSLAIRLNPICMVASYAFGELITKYRKDKKGEEFGGKVEEALSSTEAKAETLKMYFEECMGLLGPALRGGAEPQKQFLKKVTEVMSEDWLRIDKHEDDDGWEVIELCDSNESPLC